MLKRLWIVVASILIAGTASADWVGVSNVKAINAANQSIIRHEWTSTATDSTPYNISSCLGAVEGRFDPSTGDASTDATFQFRFCDESSDTAGRCRQVGWPGPSDGSTWVQLNAVTQGENYVLADALTATAGGDTARVEVRCTTAESQQTNVTNTTQPSPSMSTSSSYTNATITDPSSADFGFGIHFGDPQEFASVGTDGETYPGSGVELLEADNQMGVSYNKALNSNPVNIYEHAFDESWELSYRDDATEDGAWVEQNYDVYAPKLTATVTGITGFSPSVGSYITFSGGGTGRVYSWSSPTLVWIQFSGVTAAGETVAEAASPAELATLGTPALSLLSGGFRPYLSVWRTYSNRGSFQWDTNYGGTSTLKLQNEGVSINSDDQVVATLEVHGANSAGRDITGTQSTDLTAGGAAKDGFPVFWVQYEGENHPPAALYANTAADAAWFRMDYAGLTDAVNLVDYGHALVIQSPIEPDTASSVYQAYGMQIKSQYGVGNNYGAAVTIDSQTCAGNAACADGTKNNVEFVGGTYNTGHLTFAGQGAASDHLYRDDGNEVLRVTTDSVPTAATTGVPVVTGSGSSVYGPAMWAISNGGSFDTGNEVCQAIGVGMTCQSVINFTTLSSAYPATATCSANITSTHTFLAMCK